MGNKNVQIGNYGNLNFSFKPQKIVTFKDKKLQEIAEEIYAMHNHDSNAVLDAEEQRSIFERVKIECIIGKFNNPNNDKSVDEYNRNYYKVLNEILNPSNSSETTPIEETVSESQTLPASQPKTALPPRISGVTSGRSINVSDKPVEMKTNAEFNPDGSLKNPNEPISGVIDFTDANGKVVQMELRIEPKVLGVKTCGVNIDTSDKATYEELIRDAKKAIDGLSPELKADLLSEVNYINICRRDNGVNGEYIKEDNHINLNYAYGSSHGTIKSGINTNTITHELGHALDEINGQMQTSGDFKNNFDNFKSMLQNKGIDTNKWQNSRDEEYYFLGNEKEFHAEYTAYKNGGKGTKRYSLMAKLENSNDPEIREGFSKLAKKSNDIISNSRLNDIAQRKGDYDPVKNRILASKFSIGPNTPTIYKSLNKLMCINNYEFDSVLDIPSKDLLLKYYNYVKGDKSDKASFDAFTKLESINNSDWQNVKLEFDERLAQAGYYKT
ncbi:hypothetical protein J6N69_05320 [bacterium]|nr:hypothetical protein [bacterium]